MKLEKEEYKRLSDADPKVLGYIKYLEDRVAYLEDLAFKDEKTGLGNSKRYWIDLDEAIKKARELEISFGLGLIDLDEFKPVNDTYGHDTGDWILGEVGKAIKQNIRRSDRAYRSGGDEFNILWSAFGRWNARNSEEKARQNAQIAALKVYGPIANIEIDENEHKPKMKYEKKPKIGASVGIAIYPFDGETMKELKEVADGRMYVAKRELAVPRIYFGQDINAQKAPVPYCIR